MVLRKQGCLAIVLCFGIANAQQIASRDLVGVKPEWRKYPGDSQCEGGEGAGGGIGGTIYAASKPTLELISLNGTVFRRADDIVATVKFVNSTKKDFWIPWQENPVDFEPADGEVGRLRTMDFHLSAVDSSGKEQRIVLMKNHSSLFSSLEEGPSQLLLKPGESAQVRFMATLECDSEKCWPSQADELEIKASWYIDNLTIDRTKKCAPSSRFKMITSGESNTVTIRLQN